MSECYRCPLNYQGEEPLFDSCPGTYPSLLKPIKVAECHLTPSDFTAIRQAIAGEGRLMVLNHNCPYQTFTPDTEFTAERIECDLLDKPCEVVDCTLYQAWQDQGGE